MWARGGLADYVEKNIKKSCTTLVEGRILIRSVDQEGGGRVWLTEVDARRILVVDAPAHQPTDPDLVRMEGPSNHGDQAGAFETIANDGLAGESTFSFDMGGGSASGGGIGQQDFAPPTDTDTGIDAEEEAPF